MSATAVEPYTEEEKILLWRISVFQGEFGLSYPEAIDLAMGLIDLHEMADLVAQGCPVETAVRILT